MKYILNNYYKQKTEFNGKDFREPFYYQAIIDSNYNLDKYIEICNNYFKRYIYRYSFQTSKFLNNVYSNIISVLTEFKEFLLVNNFTNINKIYTYYNAFINQNQIGEEKQTLLYATIVSSLRGFTFEKIILKKYNLLSRLDWDTEFYIDGYKIKDNHYYLYQIKGYDYSDKFMNTALIEKGLNKFVKRYNLDYNNITFVIIFKDINLLIFDKGIKYDFKDKKCWKEII